MDFPLAVPLSQFRTLGWAGLTIVIAENKMTVLTLPRMNDVPRDERGKSFLRAVLDDAHDLEAIFVGGTEGAKEAQFYELLNGAVEPSHVANLIRRVAQEIHDEIPQFV